MKKIQENSKWITILLIGILCLQTIFGVYFGYQKNGYMEDEMATFSLANYPDGFISRTESLMNQWVESKALYDTLTISSEERFDYNMVYVNQESDVHPPFYYYVIHTISSMFPEQFSKWMGIVPNIVCCLLISILLFLVAKRLMQDEWAALITVVGWAFSIGMIDQITLIRMYAMFTFFSVLLVYIHIKALDEILSKDKISVHTIVLLYVCTLMGLLTQYYYAIFCLFLCGTFLLYLVYRKRWRDSISYLVTEFGAIATAVLYYPATITHIFGSGYRGQEAFENLESIDNFAENFRAILQIISNDMFNGWLKELCIICIIFLMISIIDKYVLHLSVTTSEGNLKINITWVAHLRKKWSVCIPSETIVVGTIGTVGLFYCMLVSKVAPFQVDRYYMCVYPLLMLCFVYFINKVFDYIGKNRMHIVANLLIIIVIIIGGLVKQEPSYLYTSPDRYNILEKYSGQPAIVINDAYSWYATRWITEFENYSEIYLCEFNSDFEQLNNAVTTGEVENGFLLYVLRFSESDEELLKKIQEYIPVEEYEKMIGGRDRVFYCTLEK